MNRSLAPTYIATRVHPEVGVILKVGTSGNPPKRCSSLGAQLRTTLRHHCESDLKCLLEHKRVWKRQNGGMVGPEPIYAASSEWFHVDKDVIALLRDYLERLA